MEIHRKLGKSFSEIIFESTLGI